MNIVEATAAYEGWLARFFKPVAQDLQAKHAKMADPASPFMFLRGTYYRWAARFPRQCPKPFDAPAVVAVGDLHIENFGTWRDAEGRLAWGVNDFDEVFDLPYTNDLVRLATSAVLASLDDRLALDAESICRAIVDGYAHGLELARRWRVRPFVVAERNRWLAALLGDRMPEQFWRKLRDDVDGGGVAGAPPAGAVAAIESMLPSPPPPCRYAPRRAGVGSLGRPRFVGLADSHGSPLAREAKAWLPSASAFLKGDDSDGDESTSAASRLLTLLSSAGRCPDPYYGVVGAWVTRRLSPDCDKIGLGVAARGGDGALLLRVMGQETANLHAATPKAIKDVTRHLQSMGRRWLAKAALAMARDTHDDWEQWKEHQAANPRSPVKRH